MARERSAKMLRPLKGRVEYLRGRLEHDELTPGARHYIESEVDSLDWAIEILEDMLQRDLASPENVVHQRVLGKWKQTAIKALWHLAQHEPERVRAILANGPDGINREYGAFDERKRYGSTVPRADDTRSRNYKEVEA